MICLNKTEINIKNIGHGKSQIKTGKKKDEWYIIEHRTSKI